MDQGIKSPSASIGSPSGLSDFAASPDRDASLHSPTADPSSVASALSLQQSVPRGGQLSESDKSFGKRADKRKVEMAFPARDGPDAAPPLAAKKSAGESTPAYEELGDSTEKSDRYMHDKFATQSAALRKRCEELGQAILDGHTFLTPPPEEDPLDLTQDTVTIVGRICIEAVAPKFTAQTCYMECVWTNDSGRPLAERAKLDLGMVQGYSVFPGQIVAVQGVVLQTKGEKVIKVSKLVDGLVSRLSPRHELRHPSLSDTHRVSAAHFTGRSVCICACCRPCPRRTAPPPKGRASAR
jgi:hypothetical protein